MAGESGQVLPANPASNSPRGGSRNVKGFSDRVAGFSCVHSALDFYCLFFGEAGTIVNGSMRWASKATVTRVLGVLLKRAQEQVSRIHAWRIVAGMPDDFMEIERAVVEVVHYPTGAITGTAPTSVETPLPVASIATSPGPVPALIFSAFGDKCHELGNFLWREIHWFLRGRTTHDLLL